MVSVDCPHCEREVKLLIERVEYLVGEGMSCPHCVLPCKLDYDVDESEFITFVLEKNGSV